MLEDLLILLSRTEVGVRIGFVPSALVLVAVLRWESCVLVFLPSSFLLRLYSFFIMLSLETSTVSPQAPPLLGVWS